MENPDRVAQDELFAENAIRTARENGIIVEVSCITNPQTGEKDYYAMTISKAEHDQIVEKTNNAIANQQPSPSEPLIPTFPLEEMLWEDVVAQPTFCEGFSSRRSALTASMRLFNLRRISEKLKQPSSPARTY